MTAESVVLNVLPVLGINDTSPNLSDGSFQSRQLLALMTATGRDVTSRGEWSRLFTSFTATGDAPLPDDFLRLTESGAVWVGTTPVRVVVAPEQWAFLRARPSSQPYCHIRGGRIEFAGLIGTATVNYVSRNWVNSRASDAVTQNGDTFAFPDAVMVTGLVARWRRQKGLPYDDQLAEHEAEIDSALRADRGVK